MARGQEREDEIDGLYRLPLAEFIAARNALAKAAGAGATGIRALPKPTLPAWAVNQLYWSDRKSYDELVARARDLRATHDAALRGRPADVRAASRAHEEAVERALTATLAILAKSGEPVTDATRQAIATTLRGLPADGAPGRLARPLQPRGFEMLAGALAPGRVHVSTPSRASGAAKPAGPGKAAARLAAARDALAAAERLRKEAEQDARREEFAAARASREAERAVRRVDDAARAIENAQAALADAQKAADAAAKARDAAHARAVRATERLAAARDREEQARAAADEAG